MNPQPIQNKIGQYKVVGPLSYGSTSHVFKVKQLEPKDVQTQASNQFQTNTELVAINMNFHQGNQSQNQDEASQSSDQQPVDEKNKDWILKMYNMKLMEEGQFSENVKYDIFIQMLLLTYLDHPGIVKARQMLLEYKQIPDPQNPTQTTQKLLRAGIVMEICEKGCFNSLNNYISRTKNLKQNKIHIMKFYLTQIANTLIYLNSSCKILHRDIKPENIMINKQLDIKIIDYGVSKITLPFLEKIFTHPQKSTIFQLFGLQQHITPKQLFAKIRKHQTKRKNFIGSKHYISPELVQKHRSDMELVEEAYEKTDVWSFGVFMYRVFHDKYPFDGRNLREILDNIMEEFSSAKINPDLPQQVRQVIAKCLKKDHSERASWSDLMKMKYFAQMPVNQIFNIVSPIGELIKQNKQEKQKILLNTDRIFFDEKLVLKYQNESNKKRRVMLIKQKDSPHPKLLVLKQKQSISLQIPLLNQNCLKISRQQKFLQIQYKDQNYDDTIQICNNLSKETGEKLIDSIFQAFELKESKLQTKLISTSQLQ